MARDVAEEAKIEEGRATRGVGGGNRDEGEEVEEGLAALGEVEDGDLALAEGGDALLDVLDHAHVHLGPGASGKDLPRGRLQEPAVPPPCLLERVPCHLLEPWAHIDDLVLRAQPIRHHQAASQVKRPNLERWVLPQRCPHKQV